MGRISSEEELVSWVRKMNRLKLIARAAEKRRARESSLRTPGAFRPSHDRPSPKGIRERQGTDRHCVDTFSDVSVSDAVDLKDFTLL